MQQSLRITDPTEFSIKAKVLYHSCLARVVSLSLTEGGMRNWTSISTFFSSPGQLEIVSQNDHFWQGMVAHTCNPGSLGG